MKTILEDGTVTSFTFANKIANANTCQRQYRMLCEVQETYTGCKKLPSTKDNMVDDVITTVDYAIYIKVVMGERKAGLLTGVPVGYDISKCSFQAITVLY